MPDYMVRVEIFKAESDEYSDMHKALEEIGLKRTVQGDNGLYILPPGTYHGSSTLTTYEMREKVRTVVSPFSHPAEPSVFVDQSDECSSWPRFA